MRRSAFTPVLVVLVAILTVSAGIVSASRMIPQDARSPERLAFLAAGGAASDICGGSPSEDGHRCPFCRLLADPPDIRVPHRRGVLRHVVRSRPRGALCILARRLDRGAPPRGPPVRS